jgi:hypothetical protein
MLLKPLNMCNSSFSQKELKKERKKNSPLVFEVVGGWKMVAAVWFKQWEGKYLGF